MISSEHELGGAAAQHWDPALCLKRLESIVLDRPTLLNLVAFRL